MKTFGSTRLHSWIVLAGASALVATMAACGGDDDDGGGGGGGDASIETFETNADAFDALSAGRVDAVALTSFTVVNETEDMSGFEATEGFIPEIDGEPQIGCGGFGFRYEDEALRDAFNSELATMQEADEVLPVIEPFGFDEEAVSTAVDQTANDLSGGVYDDIDADGGDREVDEAALAPYRENGIVIGIAAEPPYGYEEDGQATGEAPELAREIFGRLDIEVTDYTSTEFGALIDGLNAGRMDVISAGMFITPERAEQVLFANPDYCATTAFAVPEGNPADLSDLDSVFESGVTVGVVAGTVEKDYLETIQEGQPDSGGE
jgi:ABC-type amino acid transport substrate-binding protein